MPLISRIAVTASRAYGEFSKPSAIPIPTGLIIPYTSTAPAGWTDYTAPNGFQIVGAGTSYTVGTSGGSASPTVASTTNTDGGHTLGTFGSGSGGGSNTSSGVTAGAHSHSFSGSVTAADKYKTFNLIKANAGNLTIPSNAIIFSTATSFAGLTNVESSTDSLLRSGTYGTTGGSSSPTGNIGSNTDGSHVHGNNFNDGGNGSSCPRMGATSGAHSHTVSVSMSLNTKRAYLSAWSNASANYNLQANCIALWESGTPPAGWFICNGANGTLDLRDYFLWIGNTTNHGTRTGDNASSWSASASATVVHDHTLYQLSGAPTNTNATHASASWSHAHTASGSVSVTQPYYALYFIQFGG